jgi:hypothetical protein
MRRAGISGTNGNIFRVEATTGGTSSATGTGPSGLLAIDGGTTGSAVTFTNGSANIGWTNTLTAGAPVTFYGGIGCPSAADSAGHPHRPVRHRAQRRSSCTGGVCGPRIVLVLSIAIGTLKCYLSLWERRPVQRWLASLRCFATVRGTELRSPVR